MNKEKKKRIPSKQQHPQIPLKVNPKHLEEQESLFSKADEISPVNKIIDKKELIKLNSGEELDLKVYISENYSSPSLHYSKELFYFPLADLFGVDKKLMEKFRKPHFVAIFKNNFILSRFPQKVVNRIREKNRYTSYCRRDYYHYQLLTNAADEKYKLFIWQAQELIKSCTSVKQFMQEYCTKYGLPIQLNIFENFAK